MKIYITGATGFVGMNLVEYYKDHEVIQHKRTTDIGANLDYYKPDVSINCAAEIYIQASCGNQMCLWYMTV